MQKPPLPKEHGSWVMFATPLLLGLILAPVWHWQAVILVIAALGLFLLRYPLALLVKGRKRKNVNRLFLWRWAMIYGGIAVVDGGWLVFGAKLWWLVPLGGVGVALVGFHLWLLSQRKEMSAIGELAGIAGLALGAPLAYYAASQQLDAMAVVLWLLNAIYFGGTVFYVKLKVRQQPRQPMPVRLSERAVAAKACLTYQSVALTVIILLVAFRQAPILALLAFIPAAMKNIYGAWRWQNRKSLNLVRLGLVEVAHTVLFAALIVATF